MTTQSGGYCGNNIKEGPEQCDGLALPSPLPSCRALGYDYSARVRCFNARGEDPGAAACNAVPGGFVVDSADVSRLCCDLPGDDVRDEPVSCSVSCGLTGCKRCQEDAGDGTITAQVFDAFYGNQPAPNARVTLYNRGIRVSETFTDPDGKFTFSAINRRSECGFYRIIVDMPRDNSCTGPMGATRASCDGTPWPADYPNVDESVNGGYWPFESEQFTVATFAVQGLRDTGITGGLPRIFLIPRVSVDETMAVLTWSGVLPRLVGGSSGYRYIDEHLVTPESLYFRQGDLEYSRCPGPGSTVPGSSEPCVRDISYQNPGVHDLDEYPHARLSCFHNDDDSGMGEDCGSFKVAPQAIRYKRGPHAVTGDYQFFVNDWRPQGPLNSALFYTSVNATVRVVTYDRIYTVPAPPVATATVDAACNAAGGGPTDGPYALGKYWKVFKQNAASGAMTIYGGGNGVFMCTGSRTSWPDTVRTPATGDDAMTLPAPLTP
jgi:hypothetical protein